MSQLTSANSGEKSSGTGSMSAGVNGMIDIYDTYLQSGILQNRIH